MSRIVLDTDVASLSFKRRLPPSLIGKLIHAEPAITFVTQGELSKWSVRRSWGAAQQDRMTRWLDVMPVLHSTARIVTLWGEISAYVLVTA